MGPATQIEYQENKVWGFHKLCHWINYCPSTYLLPRKGMYSFYYPGTKIMTMLLYLLNAEEDEEKEEEGASRVRG